MRLKSRTHAAALGIKWVSGKTLEALKYKAPKPRWLRMVKNSICLADHQSHYAECKGMTNLHPKGEWYLIPTSWNTWRGTPMSQR